MGMRRSTGAGSPPRNSARTGRLWALSLLLGAACGGPARSAAEAEAEAADAAAAAAETAPPGQIDDDALLLLANSRAPALGPLHDVAVPSGALPRSWLRIDERGYLAYTWPKKNGDRLPEFSHVGYRQGSEAFPKLRVLKTLQPLGGTRDDAPVIQAAIDAAAQVAPDGKGRRGAILLKRGNYRLYSALRLNVGGVVLRGESPSSGGTVLKSYVRPTDDEPRPSAIVIGESGEGQEQGARFAVLDRYVPIRATRVRLSKVAGLRRGDDIVVVVSTDSNFLRRTGMGSLTPVKEGQRVYQWPAEEEFLRFERRVEEVFDDGQIRFDIPLPNAIAADTGGGYVSKFSFPTRIREVGVENLRGLAAYDPAVKDSFGRRVDERHAWNFIAVKAARDVWIQQVTAAYFAYALAYITRPAKHVTVQDCLNLAPISQVDGGRRYAYAIEGQLNLVRNCTSHQGRHDFVAGSRVSGPNAFVNCDAVDSTNEVGPHQRWASGFLFDNVVTPHNIGAYNAGGRGSGHGWTGAQVVFWNNRSRYLFCESPPGALNWAFGSVSRNKSVKCEQFRLGAQAFPPSLYAAQLADRKARQSLD